MALENWEASKAQKWKLAAADLFQNSDIFTHCMLSVNLNNHELK